ncbi:chemotaxis protein, partial [Virgibacillus halodenitrificans]|nr:chemotaxis protein [Virgibacillus halodenitrificans]
MTQKIAVAIIHGAGTPKKSFAGKLIDQISEQFSKQLFIQDAVDQLVFEPVYWSSIFADEQEKLWEKMHKS